MTVKKPISRFVRNSNDYGVQFLLFQLSVQLKAIKFLSIKF